MISLLRMPMLFALVALAAGTGEHASARGGASPVQKVLQLIDDFIAKVSSEQAESTKIFEEFAKLCDDEASEKTRAAQGSRERIENLGAAIQDANAGIDTQESTVSDLSGLISSKEKELSEAVSLRESQNADFVAAEKELLETVQSLAVAQETLKKSLSLMQASGATLSDAEEQVVNDIAQSLGQIAEASFVTTQQRQQIESFFQQKEDADDDLTFGARTSASAGGSDAIMETLQEMEDKATETLGKTRNEEREAANSHALLKQGLENEIQNSKQAMAEATQKKAALVESLAQAEKDSAVEKKSLTETEADLRDRKRECQHKATGYEAGAKDAKAELTALNKAKEILSAKFAASSFVQVMSKTQAASRTKMRSDDGSDSRLRALNLIQQLGKKYHSTALVSLAYRAAADPFVKVRKMIEDMVAKLLQEAAEEATQKAMCDKEIGDSMKQKASKEGKMDKLSARLDKAEAATATLAEEISALSNEVAESDGAVAEATKIRTEEKNEFKKVDRELSESEEACSAAITVLREYYEGAASLLQVRAKTQAKSKMKAEDRNTEADGSGIISVLEVAESDFANSLAEARTAEQAAASDFDKFIQESKQLKATKEMEIKGKRSEVKSLKTRISENSEDKSGISDELDAVVAYLDKLKPQCETKSSSYAEVVAKRQAEIDGLKEALNILSDEGVALLQTGRFLHRAPSRL